MELEPARFFVVHFQFRTVCLIIKQLNCNEFKDYPFGVKNIISIFLLMFRLIVGVPEHHYRVFILCKLVSVGVLCKFKSIKCWSIRKKCGISTKFYQGATIKLCYQF